MNIVDYVIIGIVAISVLFGLYRGFVSSVLSMGGGLLSFLASFALYPKLAALIQNNQELQRTLLHYTDASSRIGDLELALTNVVTLSREGIQKVLVMIAGLLMFLSVIIFLTLRITSNSLLLIL